MWQKAKYLSRASLSTSILAHFQSTVVMQWCAQVVEMKWLAVCEAKAAFFNRFMRMSSVMHALKRHRLRRCTKRVSCGVAVQHHVHGCKRRAVHGWCWAVSARRHKNSKYSMARQFARHHCLQAALAGFSSHCQSRRQARTVFLARLCSVAASTHQHAVQCALKEWLSLAHMHRVLKQNLATIHLLSSSHTLCDVVSMYVPASELCRLSLPQHSARVLSSARLLAGGRPQQCRAVKTS